MTDPIRRSPAPRLARLVRGWVAAGLLVLAAPTSRATEVSGCVGSARDGLDILLGLLQESETEAREAVEDASATLAELDDTWTAELRALNDATKRASRGLKGSGAESQARGGFAIVAGCVSSGIDNYLTPIEANVPVYRESAEHRAAGKKLASRIAKVRKALGRAASREDPVKQYPHFAAAGKHLDAIRALVASLPAVAIAYPDQDADGWGDVQSEGTRMLLPETGFTELFGDCDDSDSSINPEATEILGNFIDDNCNGDVDED